MSKYRNFRRLLSMKIIRISMKIIRIKSFILKNTKYFLCFLFSLAQRFLWFTGLFEFYLRLTNKNGAIILMYHSITNSKNHCFIDSAYAINIDAFEQQMKFLSKHRNVISMDELSKKMAEGITPKRGTVVISFDDGYLDNYELAAPILKKYNLPAIIYLATGYISRGEPQWIDQLHWIFQTRTCHTLSLEDKGICTKFDLRKKHEQHRAHSELVSKLLESEQKARASLLSQIQNELKPSHTMPRITLIWDEIKEMIDKYPNIEFGAHTNGHVSLTTMDKDSIIEDIATCKKKIELQLGYCPKHFTYPYGRSNSEVRSIIESMDFKSAAVTDPASLVDKYSDLFLLPRLNAPKSMSLFRALTGGATMSSISRRLSCNI